MAKLTGCAFQVLVAIFVMARPVHASCEHLRQLANQNSNLYARSGDPAHQAAAQNYMNGYNACMRTNQPRTGVPGSSGMSAALGIANSMMGILSILNSENAVSSARDAAARREAERQLERDRENLARMEAERARAEQERMVREREEAQRMAAIRADQQARCATRNPFGDASGCADTAPAAASPFKPCPRPLSSGCDWGGTGPNAASGGATGSRFAASSGRNAPTTQGQSPANPRATPGGRATGDYYARNRRDYYDSVRKRSCPGIIGPDCVADHVREGFALLAKYGKQIPKYQAPDYSMDIISTEQYERMGRGEATFEDIEDENLAAWSGRITARVMADLERQLASIPADPGASRVIQELRRAGQN